MMLIADSGSTKTDWRWVGNGQETAEFLTAGINPFYQTEAEIGVEIERLAVQLGDRRVNCIYFYGAGCHFSDKKLCVSNAVSTVFPDAKIEVNNDLLGACRALFGREKGIVCILGTGSNSCFYDGKKIVENVSPLGFILGDEGSGAVLGKRLVADVLKNQLPKPLVDKFLNQYTTSVADVLNNVYKRPFPSRYLAGFVPFLLENIAERAVFDMVYQSFHDFFVRNVMQYDFRNYEVRFTGSVAWHFRAVLAEAAAGLGIEISKIIPSPMAGLLGFH